MPGTITLTTDDDDFVQGSTPANVAITVLGLAGDDFILLDRSDDLGGRNRVDAGSGADRVGSAKEDGNLIDLGAGSDRYTGGGFGTFATDLADTVRGGGGDDIFIFSTFKSRYEGGAGEDFFLSEGWQNIIRGGSGIDTISYKLRSSAVTINLARDRVETGATRIERLNSIENARGSQADDIIIGNALDNALTGGGGLDALRGGRGADRFIFTDPSDARVSITRAEIIEDFSRRQGDKIDLSQIDARSGPGNQAFTFIGGTDFTGQRGELRVTRNSPDDLLVQGDVDGDGAADFQFLVAGETALRASDFLL
jgi:Ca2+-binding RTX toxin-like protein